MNLNLLYNRKINALAFIFLFYFIVSICIPLTGDDWTWKSAEGIKRLKSGFYNYNGRYISNVLEIILVRSSILKVLFMTFTSYYTLIFINKIIDNKLHPFVSFILICLLPIPVFAQTYGWVAGFVNYNISILLVLIMINIYKSTANNTKNLELLYYFCFALISMLFVEHVTIYLFLISIFFNVKFYICNKMINKKYFSLFIGHLFGMIIMFSNKAYMSIFLGEDTYRTIQDERPFLTKATQIFVEQMNILFGIYNLPILILLFSLFIILLNKYKVNPIIIKIGIYLFLLNILINLLLFKVILNKDIIHAIHYISSLLLLLSFLYMFAVLIINYNSDFVFRKILFYLTGFALLTGPFFVITPYGGRCALASLIFLIIIILIMIDNVITNDIKEKINVMYYQIFVFVCIFVFIAYIIPLSSNKAVEMKRDSALENLNAVNKSIEIKMIPYPNYHQMPNPVEGVYMTQFYKENLNIDQSVKLIPENQEVD
ncbi:DUF6056 family protein [Macrococcus armenti]|uniref:DUF6056 family protein n=1 Tax=Macrococcus armenti TaxID=2875764 RepID=A0ABY3ZZ13_9STAP|nr:DUF6056 family protein [Macrococcus armenti]UOB21209.1 DUF6056 family protein [Macrococcus armenti]